MLNQRNYRVSSLLAAAFLLSTPGASLAGVVYQTGFEPSTYTTGNVQGQDGWGINGPTGLLQVETLFPRSGTQSLVMRSVGLGFANNVTRPLALDMATSPDKILVVSSDAALTTGTRSDWDLNTVFGSAGFLGSLRILGNNEIAVSNFDTLFLTGVFTGLGYNNYALRFDFNTGFMSAFRNGTQIISGLPFNNANTSLTSFAVGTSITPRVDAIFIDNFSVSTTVPEPGTAALIGLALVGLGATRRLGHWAKK